LSVRYATIRRDLSAGDERKKQEGMGRLFTVDLNKVEVYACSECDTHLSSKCQIISKNFHGRGGKAYLMDGCVNVYFGPKEERRLLTGKHEVADIFCVVCHAPLGWKYIR
jgi:hypothetical protein